MISDKLIIEAEEIIDKHKEIFHLLKETYCISKQNVLDAFIEYNSNVQIAKNSIYERLDIRIAMFIEYNLKRSWHQERQRILINFLKTVNANSIIDVGFGTPMKYIKDFVIPGNITLTLADKYQSAFTFANIIFDYWRFRDNDRISYKLIDLDEIHFLGNYDAYIFQDTIEHATDPKGFLSYNVECAPSNSWFILSLPIAPIIPCHHISWATIEEAVNWTETCGLKIIDSVQVFVNPEVDEFAHDLGNISDLMLITKKNEKI